MKKLLLSLILILSVGVSIAQEKLAEVELTLVRKYDTNQKLLYERDTYAKISVFRVDGKKQVVFYEGYKSTTYEIISSSEMSTQSGMKNTTFYIRNLETQKTLYLQIFHDETYGLRFVTDEGVSQYLK
jgi:hypothetical protein